MLKLDLRIASLVDAYWITIPFYNFCGLAVAKSLSSVLLQGILANSRPVGIAPSYAFTAPNLVFNRSITVSPPFV